MESAMHKARLGPQRREWDESARCLHRESLSANRPAVTPPPKELLPKHISTAESGIM